jgi:hypothetical protein
MRPGNNNNRRGRNRGQRKPHGGMPNKSQNFDSGAETRVRGNVYQVLEKYLQLARDAGVAGDRVAAENFLQHADHYYRVVMAMNDGQRPRIGGREISVADVNVQNVSQGLSAALYSGGPSQPNMSDNAGNQAPSQGNGAPRNNENFNGQGGNNQGNSARGNDGQGEDGQGEDGHDDDGQDGDHQGDGEGGNYQQRPQQGQGRDQGGRDQGGRDRNRQRREFRPNDGQRNDGQRNDGRDNRQGRNDGQRDSRQNEGRQNDGRQNDNRGENRQGDNRQGDNRQGEFRDRGNGNQPVVSERPPEAVAAPAPVAPVTDEQPDYPEHLLPPAAEAQAEAPRAARTPRPRQQRVRRPRAAEGDGESNPEAVPATEGSE